MSWGVILFGADLTKFLRATDYSEDAETQYLDYETEDETEYQEDDPVYDEYPVYDDHPVSLEAPFFTPFNFGIGAP